MSTLSWNCRGLGNLRAIQVLKDLVSLKRPVFIFLMETLIGRTKLEFIHKQLGYEGLFMVENRGHSGGLALLRKQKDIVSFLGYSRNHIDIVFHLPRMKPWRLTGFYGFPERSRRRDS